jgi:hypothetical protein
MKTSRVRRSDVTGAVATDSARFPSLDPRREAHSTVASAPSLIWFPAAPAGRCMKCPAERPRANLTDVAGALICPECLHAIAVADMQPRNVAGRS